MMMGDEESALFFFFAWNERQRSRSFVVPLTCGGAPQDDVRRRNHRRARDSGVPPTGLRWPGWPCHPPPMQPPYRVPSFRGAARPPLANSPDPPKREKGLRMMGDEESAAPFSGNAGGT